MKLKKLELEIGEEIDQERKELRRQLESKHKYFKKELKFQKS